MQLLERTALLAEKEITGCLGDSFQSIECFLTVYLAGLTDILLTARIFFVS